MESKFRRENTFVESDLEIFKRRLRDGKLDKQTKLEEARALGKSSVDGEIVKAKLGFTCERLFIQSWCCELFCSFLLGLCFGICVDILVEWDIISL